MVISWVLIQIGSLPPCQAYLFRFPFYSAQQVLLMRFVVAICETSFCVKSRTRFSVDYKNRYNLKTDSVHLIIKFK